MNCAEIMVLGLKDKNKVNVRESSQNAGSAIENIGVSFLDLPQILHHFQQFPPTDILKLGYHIQNDRIND